MKIGIVTYSSAHNYGAVLQAWALQTYLKKQGYQVEIVNYRPWVIDDVYAMAKKKKMSKNRYLNLALNKARIVKSCLSDKEKFKRYRRFEKFIAKDLNTTKVYRKYTEAFKDESLDYDVLIAGSDQIWNSAISKKISPMYFLDFGPKNAKRISYAASIGGERLPEEEEYIFRTYLRAFDYISVREVNAQESVQQYTTKPVELVSDPTFLIGREDFAEIKKDFKVEGKYIYVHNVHLVREDKALNEVAEELSKRTGLPIVHNRKEKFFTNEGRKFLSGSPGEFIGVISNAEYVVTNSFHATVFSIIYNRNFITVPHFKNPDRMKFLLSSLGIENHLIAEKKQIPKDLTSLEIDYTKVESKKEKMGEASREFLRKAIESPKTTNDGNYLLDGDCMKCYGCGLCGETEMEMQPESIEKMEDFWYPDSVEEGQDKCIYHNDDIWNQSEDSYGSYLAHTKEKHILREDTLLDMITPMAKRIFAQNGKVAGLVFENTTFRYTMISDEEALSHFCVEEFFEAKTEGIYAAVRAELEKGLPVLFCGTACRIAALKLYLGRTYDELCTIQITGRGVSSAEVFRKYIHALETTYKSKVTEIEFNNKFRHGEEDFIIIKFASGSIKVENVGKNLLMRAVQQRILQRPSCYTCELISGEYTIADIELGKAKRYVIEDIPADESEQEQAVIRLNTEKGKIFWQEVAEEYEIIPINKKNFTVRRNSMTYKRNRLFKELATGEAVEEVLEKYTKEGRR